MSSIFRNNNITHYFYMYICKNLIILINVMVNVDFLCNKDKNGFVRLESVPMYNKFVEKYKQMLCFHPTPTDAKYKNYKVHYGDFDFKPMSQAEMFVKRVIGESFFNKWYEVQYKPAIDKGDPYFYTESNKYRKVLIYFTDVEVLDGYKDQPIVLKGTSTDPNFPEITVCIDSLGSRFCFRELTNDEVDIIDKYKKICIPGPAPMWQLMIHKQEYKDDYSLYLADCKKYGFNALSKNDINKFPLVDFNDNIITFDKNGRIGWHADNGDTEIVNK